MKMILRCTVIGRKAASADYLAIQAYLMRIYVLVKRCHSVPLNYMLSMKTNNRLLESSHRPKGCWCRQSICIQGHIWFTSDDEHIYQAVQYQLILTIYFGYNQFYYFLSFTLTATIDKHHVGNYTRTKYCLLWYLLQAACATLGNGWMQVCPSARSKQGYIYCWRIVAWHGILHTPGCKGWPEWSKWSWPCNDLWYSFSWLQ